MGQRWFGGCSFPIGGTISAAVFNQLLADDGVVTLTFTPSAAVNNFGSGQFLTVTLSVPSDFESFVFEANGGDTLTLTTTTPGSGPLEPSNTFDPLLQLFFEDAAGGPTLVALDDNGARTAATLSSIIPCRRVPRARTGRPSQAAVAATSRFALPAPPLCQSSIDCDPNNAHRRGSPDGVSQSLRGRFVPGALL